jgi:hypothetical protein
MMKFSRSYDRSVLIYKEDGPDGRILLRLGRTFEDGECRADNDKTIPDGFEILTYIIAKDPEALIDDISEKFSEYLDDATQLTFRSIMFDTLKLQERIAKEQKDPGGSEMIRSLDLLYGKQVMEILFAATFGKDGRKNGKSAKSRNPADEKSFSVLQVALIGFMALVILPLVVLAILRPEAYTPVREAIKRSAIIAYATRDEALASASLVDSAEDIHERIFEQVRTRKQEFYLTSGFGELSEDEEYIRSIPGFSQDSNDVVPDVAEYSDPLTIDSEVPEAQNQEPLVIPEMNITTTAMGEGDQPAKPLIETLYGIPQTIANFEIKSFSTYDAGDPVLETFGTGASASYEIARDPATVFEVVRGDLSGISSALDRVASQTCETIAGDSSNQDDKIDPDHLVSTNFTMDIGKSPFIAAVIDEQACEEGSYVIYPMFDLELNIE